MLILLIGLPYIAVIVVLYDGWCRPFSEFLVLHPQNEQCLSWIKYNILQLSMNLSTDMVLILIPVARISRLKMKIGKILLIMADLKHMLSAILLKVAVFSGSADLIDPPWIVWAVREVSMAVLVGNLVLCVPVLKMLWSFFTIRISSIMNRIPTSENGDESNTHAGRQTTTAKFEPRDSNWYSISEAPQNPEDHGHMVDVDLEE
ncbi:hypothetical protein LX32DRAFT_597585 [Colletotrichum zoysiae]|uniref:Integral membrane protein n=1 Tax=Colletotrichum zoysiae TaxID=1216348 RepID=A0AAD9M0K5_9PEZI|nr:hypothetical protein LX32DRAFT_597585 [Colletotrichum zoysiae]